MAEQCMALKSWQPGQSGNPTGGGYANKLAAYVRSLAGEDGRLYLDILHGIAATPHRDTKTRVVALQMLLDRGWGKPKETIALEGALSTVAVSPEAVAKLSDTELDAALTLVLRLRQITAEDGPGRPADALAAAPPMETLPASSAALTTTQGLSGGDV